MTRSSPESPVSRLGGFAFAEPPDPEWFRARVTAAGVDAAGVPVHSLQAVRVTDDGSGLQSVDGDLTTDYTQGEPAYELNHAAVPVGTYVLARVRQLVAAGRVYEFVIGGVAGDASFLAVIVDVKYPDAQGGLLTYSWAGVTSGPPGQYYLTGAAGCPGNNPAYEQRNRSVPAVGPVPSGSGGGCPLPAFVHPWSVYRLRQVGGASGSGAAGSGGAFCTFSGDPVVDLFRDTGEPIDAGYAAYLRLYDQHLAVWYDADQVILLTAD